MASLLSMFIYLREKNILKSRLPGKRKNELQLAFFVLLPERNSNLRLFLQELLVAKFINRSVKLIIIILIDTVISKYKKMLGRMTKFMIDT